MGKKRSKNDGHPPHSQPSKSTRKRRKPRHPALDPGSGSGSSSDSDCSRPSSPASTRRLLEPYSKPRLVAFLAGAAAADPALLARVRATADGSLSHRRLFVHGLPPHADAPALEAAFSAFGPVSDCHVIVADDRTSGSGARCKGYGFLTFRSRAAARRAVRSPCGVRVAGRPVSVQFASAGSDPSGAAAATAGRRVYVTNVAPDASAEGLRAFFARFGELEGGPFGFDAETGRSRGYALFLYRAADGAMRALEEPYRVFEGRTLHCQLAADPARKKNKAAAPPGPASVSSSAAAAAAPASAASATLRPVLDAVVAAGAGDLAMYARNPAQAAALLGRNPILAAAALNAALASAGAVLPTATAMASTAAAAPSPAPCPAVSPVPLASQTPATAAAVAPLPLPWVKASVRPSGGAGLLGPYKPPSSPAATSSSARKGTVLGT